MFSRGETPAAAALVGAGCGKDSTGPDPAENAAPTADFSSSCTDLTCTFTDLSTDSGRLRRQADAALDLIRAIAKRDVHD